MSSTNATTHLSSPQSNRTFRMARRSTQETFTFVSIYTLLVFLVIIGNSLVIIAYKRNAKLRTMTNLFFISLAVSDLLVGGISIPCWIHILLYNGQLPALFHNVYVFFDIFSALTSIAHLTAISIERKIAISRPLRHRVIPKSYYYCAIATIWAYGFTIATLFVADLKPQLWRKYRGLVSTMGGFALPLLIISYMYANIYYHVKRSNARRRFYSSTSSLQRKVQRERTTSKTVLIVTGLFVASWMPFYTLSVLYIFCTKCPRGASFLHLLDFMKFLHYSNSAINPLVYAYRSVEMRLTVMRTITPCVDRSTSVSSVRILQALPAANSSPSPFIAYNEQNSASLPPIDIGPLDSKL